MKRRFISTAIAITMLLSLAAALVPAGQVLAADLHVGTGQIYTTIQAAIDAATAGDTIIVHDGTYTESITIDKSLTIISQNGSALTTITVDDDTCTSSAVQIECGGVTFGAAGQGFTIAGGEFDDDNLGIIAETYTGDDFSNITIEGNVIFYFYYGINLYNYEGDAVSGCTITGNEVYDCDYGITLDSDLGQIYGNTISDNTIHDCYDSGDGSAGISLATYDEGSYVYGNTVKDNNVYDCDNGIILENYGGDLYENTVDGNDVSYCIYGAALWNYPGDSATSCHGYIYDNTVTGNTIHDCIDEVEGYGTGIELYADGQYGDAYSYGNTVDGNEVYDCDSGIVLWGEYDAEMYDNSVTGNTIYCNAYGNGEDGIYLYTYDGGDIYNCTVQGNTVYGWEYGIEMYNDSSLTIEYIDILDNVLYSGTTGNGYGISVGYCWDITVSGNDIGYSAWDGVYVYDSEDIYITANQIHDMDTYEEGSAAIYVEDSYSVYIYGNDIRDNDTDYGGIYLDDVCLVTINCNNLVDNWSHDWVGYWGVEAWVEEFCEQEEVNAEYNWWGDSEGFDEGDNAYGEIDAWPWLYEEYTLLPDAVIDYAAVPSTISLYDTDGMFGDWHDWPPLYTLGPSYTDIILEVECQDENPCGIEYATVNLSSLLLDMLPADFQERYVDTWDYWDQQDWYGWLNYLSEMEMEPYSTEDTCFFDFEFYLDDLLFYGFEEECNEPPYYPCWALDDFFYSGYDDYEEGSMKLGTMLFEELRLGNFMVPVTLWSCCDEEGCLNSYTVYVPLAVVDFQLPLEAGWNLRSTPVTLDAGYNTFGEMLTLGDGMTFEALITYNASSGLWEEPGLAGAVAPLSAYYIKMSGRDQMGFIVNRNPSGPPTRHLYAGWNLVSLAAPFQYYPDEYEYWPYVYPFRPMTPWVALFPARYAAGGLTGWSLAMNPAEDLEYEEHFYYKDIWLCSDSDDLPYKPPYDKHFYQEPWLAFSNDPWAGYDDLPYLTPGGGYWVFMENAADLAGYSFTPYPWAMWWD